MQPDVQRPRGAVPGDHHRAYHPWVATNLACVVSYKRAPNLLSLVLGRRLQTEAASSRTKLQSWCLYSAAVGGRWLRFVLLVRVGAVALAEACHGAAGHKPSDCDLGWTLVTVSHWTRGTTTDTGRH